MDPRAEGVKEKLEAGGSAADVGCGHGASTLLLAQAFPKARVCGFDYHDGSIQKAKEAAASDGISFATASAKTYPANGGYDLVAFFDCLHDMGDPVGRRNTCSLR